MKRPSISTVGASRTPASTRSLSRIRSHDAGRAAWALGSATRTGAALPTVSATWRGVLAIDLLQLTRSPFHGVLGVHALHGLGVHVRDDVLRVRLGGLGRRRTGEAEHAGATGRRAVALHRVVDGAPHRVGLPEPGRAHREPRLDLEPLAELLLPVEPLEEVLGQLLVRRVL